MFQSKAQAFLIFVELTLSYALIKSETLRNVIRHIIVNGWGYADEQIAFDHFAASN